MWAFFERLLDSSMFAPHGICLLWEPQLIWLHVASDVVIASAYFSIPVALSIFVSKRRDVDFGWVFWAFALFIMACGVTHVLSIITLWVPIYGIEGIIKAGLHEYLDRLQNKMNQVGHGISETFFAARSTPPVRKKARGRPAPAPFAV